MRFIFPYDHPGVSDDIVRRVDEGRVTAGRAKAHEVARGRLGLEHPLGRGTNGSWCARVGGERRQVLDVRPPPVVLGPHDEDGIERHACSAFDANGARASVALLPGATGSR